MYFAEVVSALTDKKDLLGLDSNLCFKLSNFDKQTGRLS